MFRQYSNYQSRGLLLLGWVVLVGCPGPTVERAVETSSDQVLRVSLFQWIPDAAEDDYAALRTRLEREFEAQHAVDLEVSLARDWNSPEYDIDALRMWLTDAGQFDVVEVDAILLGELVAENVIQPWRNTPDDADFHPAGVHAATVGGQRYGVPHWLCGHFIFSRDSHVLQASTAAELVSALKNARTGTPNLTGRFAGSWNLPALYVDAWADGKGTTDLNDALAGGLDMTTVSALKQVANECTVGDLNPCLADQIYDHLPDHAALQFAFGLSDATLGYSERLHTILRRAPDGTGIGLSSIPLGAGSRPLVFADVFVLRAGCEDSCREAAEAFARYMSAPQTMSWMLLSEDQSDEDTRVPRYLIPATKSAFATPGVAADAYYQAIQAQIANAVAYPNTGFEPRRRAVRDAIEAEFAR